MRNRYYAIGYPIEDLRRNLFTLFFGEDYPKKYTQEELKQLSFYKQDTIRLFASYDQAREYAHGLRENAHAYTYCPKTDVRNSKVFPIFTLELNLDVMLGNLHEELFKYSGYNNDKSSHKLENQITLNFYEMPSNSINNTDIIQAEFYNSKMSPVEFEHEINKQRCVIS